jgi:hypothetical protein
MVRFFDSFLVGIGAAMVMMQKENSISIHGDQNYILTTMGKTKKCLVPS